MCNILKTASRRAQGTNIWASGTSTACIQSTFGRLVSKVILMSFGAFPIFSNLISQKRLVVENNAPKIGPRGT